MNLIIISLLANIAYAQIFCSKVKAEDRERLGCSIDSAPKLVISQQPTKPAEPAKLPVPNQGAVQNLNCKHELPKIDQEKIEKEHVIELRDIRTYAFTMLLPFSPAWSKHIETFLHPLRVIIEEQNKDVKFMETFLTLIGKGQVVNSDSKHQEELLKYIKAANAESMVPPQEFTLALFKSKFGNPQNYRSLNGKVVPKTINEDHLKNLFKLTVEQLAANKIPSVKLLSPEYENQIIAHFKLQEKDKPHAKASLQYYAILLRYFTKQIDYEIAKSEILNSWAIVSEELKQVQQVAKTDPYVQKPTQNKSEQKNLAGQIQNPSNPTIDPTQQKLVPKTELKIVEHTIQPNATQQIQTVSSAAQPVTKNIQLAKVNKSIEELNAAIAQLSKALEELQKNI